MCLIVNDLCAMGKMRSCQTISLWLTFFFHANVFALNTQGNVFKVQTRTYVLKCIRKTRSCGTQSEKRIRTLMTAIRKIYWARAHVRLHSLSNGIHCHSNSQWFNWNRFSLVFCLTVLLWRTTFSALILYNPTFWQLIDDLLMKWRYAEIMNARKFFIIFLWLCGSCVFSGQRHCCFWH